MLTVKIFIILTFYVQKNPVLNLQTSNDNVPLHCLFVNIRIKLFAWCFGAATSRSRRQKRMTSDAMNNISVRIHCTQSHVSFGFFVPLRRI